MCLQGWLSAVAKQISLQNRVVWVRLEKWQVAESLGVFREDKKIGHSLQSTAAEFKGSLILFPVNCLGNCFVNNFYIYENVCFFFLLS